jgi:hypothetical protein
MCYILCTSSSVYIASGAEEGLRGAKSPEIFFALGSVLHFCLVFRVASIFVSIVGRFFGTWFLTMVFYFQLRN